MIFDDVPPKLPVMNEYSGRGRNNNCNMFYLDTNMFSTNGQSAREKYTLFNLFKQRGKVLETIDHDFLNEGELNYRDL